MITFIERIVAGPTHLVGVSGGGLIGILLGIHRLDLLRKLVTIGANFHGDGLLSASMWTDASPDEEAWAMPRQRYASVSPDGAEHFPIVFGKLQQMWRDGQPTLTERDLAQIPVPVLVMAGDNDVIHHAHTVALYESVPTGQLAIIPGTSHAVFMEIRCRR